MCMFLNVLFTKTKIDKVYIGKKKFKTRLVKLRVISQLLLTLVKFVNL